MKSIVLAEKPSVGRELARVLNCNQKNKSYYEGVRYIVTWALGHLVTLAEPGDYDKKLVEWRLEDLPMLPEQMKLKVLKETSHQYRAVSELLRREDVSELIIATDAGREGELVARWIMKLSGWKKPFKRLWISSQTDEAIREGFANLKPGVSYNRLYEAAVSRAEADWLIGLNITRALACKFNAQLSAGRVQTPTLAMIVERENEIKNFKPSDYWTVTADFGDYFGTWRNKDGNSRIFDKNRADELLLKIKGHSGIIREVKTQGIVEPPPLAYDLTELQRDANRHYGFSAQKTLSVLQGLYESHKIVTYPRTDSRYITSDIVPTLPKRLKSIATGHFAEWVKPLLIKPLTPGKRFVDNSRVTDHHAIIPTGETVNLSNLDRDELQLFDLIAKRFIAVLYPPFLFDRTTIITEVNGEYFYSTGKVVKDMGWKAVSASVQAREGRNDDALPEQTLKQHKQGEQKAVKNYRLEALKTRPPARYTEATLLSAMESPGKFIEDDELRESIKQGGLGTPATRAEIIEKILYNNYIERNGKELIPTSKGFQLIGLVPESLRSPALTAQWELRLSNISKGTETGKDFMKDIRENARELVAAVKSDTAEYKADNLTKNKCPECGKPMLIINGKRGKMLVCSDRICGHRQPEKERENTGSYKRSRREQGMDRRSLEKYSAVKTPIGNSFGTLLKEALEKKEK